jgi:hypothetical protein
MSLAKMHRENLKRWGGLPNAARVASFDYVDQTVLFEDLDSETIHRILNTKSFEKRFTTFQKVWLNG